MAGTNRAVRGQTKSVGNDLASWLSDPVRAVGTVLVLSVSALMLIVGMGLTGNESLLGYWQANEDANDSAGANHGIMAGGATFGTGHDGQAFSLDGANAHVSVPHVSGWDFAEGDFTISTWALLDAPPPKKHYAMMAHTAQDAPWRG